MNKEMNLAELQNIETEEGVSFSLNDAGRISASGARAGVERALARIVLFRNEVAQLLRERQGLPEPGQEIITREVSAGAVPSPAVQRANYVAWFTARPKYFHPNESELDAMFGQINEGDECIFDFAHSITVRLPNGLLVAVDRKGRVTPPSPYSPAVKR